MPEGKKLYKVLVSGKSCSGGDMTWDLPKQQKNGDYKAGKWMSVDGPIILCQRGLHVTTQPLKWWHNTKDIEVYEVEVSGESKQDTTDKSAHEFVRLLRPIDDAEFEKLFGVILIRKERKAEVIVKDGQKAYVYANAKVTAYANAKVTAYANAKVTASDNAQVTASANAKVTASDNAQVTASDNAQVTAYANAQVTASDNAKVTAYDNAQVTAYDNAQVTAYANAKVTAYDNAKVTAYDNAVIVLPQRYYWMGDPENVTLAPNSKAVLIDQRGSQTVVTTPGGILVPAK